MFARLIESERVRDRSPGGTVASVLAHSAVIGFLAYSRLSAAPWVPPVDPVGHNLIYVPVPQRSHTVTPSRCAACVKLPGPAHIDLPPVDVPPTPVFGEHWITIGTPVAAQGDPAVPSIGAASDSEGVFEIVEEPARALPGNPHPDYPSLLRSAHVTGVVSARFVVDTAGRVEPGSVGFEPGSDVLFEGSVRRALLASRFSPAMTVGRCVRMLVRQDFAFRLTP